jgi:2-haloacid dehalogenase
MAGAVVLDVNETLFSLDALDPVFADLGLADQRDLWFARTLRNGFALTSAGIYRSFPDVARGAFLSLAPERLSDADADQLLVAFAQLMPHPEVPEALERLRGTGQPVVTLSVGNAANVERLFQNSGMDGLVWRHLSCEAVGKWKPAPDPYLQACREIGVAPSETWMVAAHSWDLAGARAVGMKTAWLSRLEGRVDPNFGSPDVRGRDLMDVVTQMIEG